MCGFYLTGAGTETKAYRFFSHSENTDAFRSAKTETMCRSSLGETTVLIDPLRIQPLAIGLAIHNANECSDGENRGQTAGWKVWGLILAHPHIESHPNLASRMAMRREG